MSYRLVSFTRELLKLATCLVLVVGSSAFKSAEPYFSIEDADDGKRLTSLFSDDFSRLAESLYGRMNFNRTDSLDINVFQSGLRGYFYLRETQSIQNQKYLTIIDFSRASNRKRLWVFDLEEKKIVFNEYVAHGVKSGIDYPKYFSNSHGSNKSSIGFYTTGNTYYGSNRYSLKLNGLEPGFNSNAFARGIVIHGADYVSEQFIKGNQRLGRSFGCPAVSQEVNRAMIDLIKGESCLFIYYPQEHYLESSKLMNANILLPVEELSI